MTRTVDAIAMSASDARRLDDDIRTAVLELHAQWDDLQALLEKASQSQLHVLLGYKSWTAYVYDVFGDTPLQLERGVRTKAIIAMADELGMPTRAIGAVLGINHGTVNKILRANDAGHKIVTGRNGQEHDPALRRRPAPPPIPTEKPPRIRTIIDEQGRVEGTVINDVDHDHERLTPKPEAQRLNRVLIALAGELEALTLDPNFKHRQRYVLNELRDGIARIYEAIQVIAKERIS